MTAVSSSPSLGSEKRKILETALQQNQLSKKTQFHLLWGSANVSAVAGISYHYVNHQFKANFRDYLLKNAEWILIVILCLNIIYHIYKYFELYLQHSTPVCLNPQQKKLLGVYTNDPNFTNGAVTVSSLKSSPDKSPIEHEYTATTPINLSTTSWLNMSLLNESTSSQSHQPQPSSIPILPSSLNASFSPKTGDYWNGLASHQHRYFDDHEKTTLGSTFWWTDTTTKPSSPLSVGRDAGSLLKRSTYQLSPTSPNVASHTTSQSLEETANSPLAHLTTAEMCRRLKIDQHQLNKWTGNLRYWISRTILERLVHEFDYLNAAFQRYGLFDMQIGSVGLDRLKKTAATGGQAQMGPVPSLPRLVPFLDISPHQEYVCTRIRELSRGGSMSEYCWNGGGSSNSKPWEEHLPSDANLVMHLFATYLDLQLLPMAQPPDARPFSSQYLLRTPDKPPAGTSNTPNIYQPQINPPHFQLVDRDEILDVPKGRHNVFHVLLLFLHTIKTQCHGMLGPVNLGRSGVNILWLLDNET